MMFINFNYSKWHDTTKNWTLATKVFEKILEANPDFKILLIGRLPPKHLEHYKIDSLPWQDFIDLLGHMANSKIMLITSVYDASPRVLA